MTKNQVSKLLIDAINRLFESDSILLQSSYNINERTVSHRLALHLDSLLSNTDYDVDVEYNRMRNDYDPDAVGNLMGKRLNLDDSGGDFSIVYPDIIVHKRETDINLIIVEIKMAWKNSKRNFDYVKINEYMNELRYQHGVYVQLHENREKCVIEFGPFSL